MQHMANIAKIKLKIPRRCAKQTQRDNVKGKKATTYFRRAIFIPFVDSLILQLHDRFKGMSERALQGLILIPSNLNNISDESIEKLLE